MNTQRTQNYVDEKIYIIRTDNTQKILSIKSKPQINLSDQRNYDLNFESLNSEQSMETCLRMDETDASTTKSSSEQTEEGSENNSNKLWCLCRMPHDNRFMIECDRCEEWYHGSCVGMSESQGIEYEKSCKKWYCQICSDTMKRAYLNLIADRIPLYSTTNHQMIEKHSATLGETKLSDVEMNSRKDESKTFSTSRFEEFPKSDSHEIRRRQRRTSKSITDEENREEWRLKQLIKFRKKELVTKVQTKKSNKESIESFCRIPKQSFSSSSNKTMKTSIDPLDLLFKDTTEEHGIHIFDLHCKICNPDEHETNKSKVKHKPMTEYEKKLIERVERDRKLRSKSQFEPKNSVFTAEKSIDKPNDPTKTHIWGGYIDPQNLTQFFGYVFNLSKSCKSPKIIQDSMKVVGRLKSETVYAYLEQVKKASQNDIEILKFIPAIDEEVPYVAFFTYLYERNRFAVINILNKTKIKDLYVFPLAKDQELHPSILSSAKDTIELEEKNNRPDYLLGVLIKKSTYSRNRSKKRNDTKAKLSNKNISPNHKKSTVHKSSIESCVADFTSNSTDQLNKKVDIKTECSPPLISILKKTDFDTEILMNSNVDCFSTSKEQKFDYESAVEVSVNEEPAKEFKFELLREREEPVIDESKYVDIEMPDTNENETQKNVFVQAIKSTGCQFDDLTGIPGLDVHYPDIDDLLSSETNKKVVNLKKKVRFSTFDQILNDEQNVHTESITLSPIEAESLPIPKKKVCFSPTKEPELITIEEKVQSPDEVVSVEDPEEVNLTNEIVAEVNRVLAIQDMNEIITDKNNFEVRRKDIETLTGQNWINDEIINFYFYMLMERNPVEVHCIGTQFYSKLKESNYQSIKIWARNKDLFSFKLILIPIHLSLHWTLVSIDMTKKEINYYDSFGGDNYECMESLLIFLRNESLEKKGKNLDTENWRLINAKDIPRQTNHSDCGVFICKYADFISRNKHFTFDQFSMPFFRTRMIYEISNGKLLN